MAKTVTFKKVAQRYATGTSLQGRIDTTYSRLVKRFGPPNSKGDGYKVDAEWTMKVGPIVITIYNYKDGKNYLGRRGLPLNRIRDWHISGKTSRVVALVREALG